MKIRNLLLFCLGAAGLLGAPAVVAEKTLIGDLGEADHGGYGGPIFRFSQINGEFAVLTGGRGGWIIDHRFVLGGGGFGLANNIKVEGLGEGEGTDDLEMGYGGGMLEFIIASDEIIHFSADVLIGAGGVTTLNYEDGDDAFFVLEPGANLMLNVTKFFRLGAGVSYRFVEGVGFGELEDSDLSGMSAGLILKFGAF